LATGSLVKAFDQTLDTEASFYLMTSVMGSKKQALDNFRLWLMNNL